MSKKIVIRADLISKKCMAKILSTVAKLEEIKSIDMDQDKCTLTVVGTVDPVRVVQKLRKARFAADVISVEDDKPKEPEKKKDPCQEACEKACSYNEGPWYHYGYTPGCYSSPYAQPSSQYYGHGYGMRPPPPMGYVCYEEISHGGGQECVIQ
ncbi:heavy metal-associated isoprenylated plant protein 39-like [Lolium rigidum]|uniref:heavy metal-associated isoprenylated plant protein 39-like n=1 Tax=Lolium rigidum TaxID=89674 RepID=UPI001F5D7047|nr:heavy metal-associated isoprenylated plant protein 39-like [Lolium rigidum]